MAVGAGEPTPSERVSGVGRVEVYRCTAGCVAETRFPRHNAPGRLLETRCGRCGEWANAFTLCCRAAGFDARYVLDWTDHVWTEVYSEHKQRWLHCDACEAACDRPLLYEAGWGKQLTYVIAFARDDVQDVTWRYVASPSTTLARRRLCREAWLTARLVAWRRGLQATATPQRRETLQRRLVAEIVELLEPPVAGDGAMSGRVSGSVEWRASRGEAGGGPQQPVVIRPNGEEIARRMIAIRYDCAADVYVRGAGVGEEVRGWRGLLFGGGADVQRKEERDWKMCYLARREGLAAATLTWKFDLTGTHLFLLRCVIRGQFCQAEFTFPFLRRTESGRSRLELFVFH